MDNLPIELYEKIARQISSKELLNLVLTCEKIWYNASSLLFNMKIDYNMIKHSKFKDNFTNLTYKTRKLDFPKKIQW